MLVWIKADMHGAIANMTLSDTVVMFTGSGKTVIIYQLTVFFKKRIRKYLQNIHYLAGEQVVLLKREV